MTKRFALGLVAALLWALPALGQLPPGGNLTVGNGSTTGTPIQGGTSTDCLTVGTSNRLTQAVCGGAAAGITVGTSVITGGANTRILYDNAGVLGEYTVSGTGTVVALTASPALSGSPTAPTQSAGDNSTKIATTAYVAANVINQSATAPTTQNFTSGTAATYTTPANVKWIRVRMVGAGGGGGGTGQTTSPTGGTGGTTSFNSVTAIGGSGGVGSNATFGAGGVGGTGGAGTANVRIAGAPGGPGRGTAAYTEGGKGGDSVLGGGAVGLAPNSAISAVAPNTGAGGGGSMVLSVTNGSGGGGGGEYAELIIANPAGTYTYTVGAAGAAGIGTGTGASTGVAGAAGLIIVDEYYNF